MFDTRLSKQERETKEEDVLAALTPLLSSSPPVPCKSHHLSPVWLSNTRAQPPIQKTETSHLSLGLRGLPLGGGLIQIPTFQKPVAFVNGGGRYSFTGPSKIFSKLLLHEHFTNTPACPYNPHQLPERVRATHKPANGMQGVLIPAGFSHQSTAIYSINTRSPSGN